MKPKPPGESAALRGRSAAEKETGDRRSASSNRPAAPPGAQRVGGQRRPGADCAPSARARTGQFADSATDPLWADYRELALAHGLRGCWSTPIFDERQRVLGTFAIYYRQPGRPPELHRRYIDLATGLASAAISRTRADDVLRASEARTRDIYEQASDGLYVIPRRQSLPRRQCARAGEHLIQL